MTNGQNTSLPTWAKMSLVVVLALIGGAVGYGALQGDVKSNTKTTTENKGAIKENASHITQLELVQIKAITILERLETKVDKIGEDLKDHREDAD